MITEADRTAAATALIAWFKSQDIEPLDAAMIMSTVIAEQLVLGANGNINQLQTAVEDMNKLLIFDIAEWLRE